MANVTIKRDIDVLVLLRKCVGDEVSQRVIIALPAAMEFRKNRTILNFELEVRIFDLHLVDFRKRATQFPLPEANTKVETITILQAR